MRLTSTTVFLAASLLAPPGWAIDSDGDGVDDLLDAFPCDPLLAAESFAPGEGVHAALLFEDQWPNLGDADFNDAVLTYNYVLREDALGRARSVILTVNAIAFGGRMNLGLGLQLPIPRGAVGTVTRRVGSGAPEALAISELDAHLTVHLSANLRELFGHQMGPINALGLESVSGLPLEIEIVLASPTALDVGLAPFDLFLFRSEDPSHELHRPSYRGTARMNTALFGTGSDGSQPGGLAFIDTRGLPFALHLPVYTVYPAEEVEISRLWPRILDFAASGGAQASDFYATPNLAHAYGGTPAVSPFLRAPEPRDRSCVQAVVACDSTAQHTFTNGAVVNASNLTQLADLAWVIPPGATVTVDVPGSISITCLDVGGTLRPAGCTTTTCRTLDLDVRGSAIVRASGRIDASGLGYLGAHVSGNGASPRSYGNAVSTEVGLYSGGSHGGFGGQYPGQGIGRSYGDPLAPVLPGGGGRGYSDGGWGNGGNGGGAIRLVVAGRLELDGQILANGGTGGGSYPSSGAGGSVYISAGEIASASSGVRIQANGGAAYHGSGGGGRVAIYSPRLLWIPSADTIQATGGASSAAFRGGPGTIVTGADPRSAELLVHTPAGFVSAFGATPVGVFGAITGLTDTVLTTSARLVPGSLVGRTLRADSTSATSFTVTANSANTISVVGGLLAATAVGRSFQITDYGSRFGALRVSGVATVDFGALEIEGGATLSGSASLFGDRLEVGGATSLADSARLDTRVLTTGTFTAQGSALTVAERVTATDLTLNGSAQLTTRVSSTAGFRPLHLLVSRDLTLATGARIHVDGRGYLGAHNGGNGGFARTYANGTSSELGLYSGGSHGGFGGQYTGQGVGRTFGDLYRPVEAGGGGRGYSDGGPGAGGNGGGALRIEVGRAFALNGVVSADGANGPGSYPSGGAGGSVWITVGGTLSRSASGVGVRANGSASYHGAGGGGRVAIYAGNLAFNVDPTTVQALGGSSSAAFHGGPGTIVFGPEPGAAQLLVHTNSGLLSARGATPIGAFGTITALTDTVLTTSAPLVPGALAGATLRPDGAREETRTILANSANTITVAGGLGALTAVGRSFHVTDFGNAFTQARVSGAATVDFGLLSVSGDLTVSGTSRADGGRLVVGGALSLVDSARIDVTRVEATTISMANGALVITEAVRATDLTLANSARITGRAPSTAGIRPVTLEVLRDLTLGAGTTLDVDGLGYLGAHESGNSNFARTYGNTTSSELGLYSGGSHGGFGGQYPGQGVGRTFGDLLEPREAGGGGRGYSDGGWGAGGNGGGVLRVDVGRDFALNGIVTANGRIGSGSYPSSGAGGSVWITVGGALTRSSSGVGVRANGGNAYHGAGGGGRVAIYAAHTTWTIDATTVQAVGGSSSAAFAGGPGTIAFGTGPGNAQLLVHSPGLASAFGPTPIGVFGVITALTDTTLTTSARLEPGALVGRTLRPDRDGPATMTIVANSANTIVVAGGLTSATAVGRTFHVADFNTSLAGLTVSGASGIDLGVMHVAGPIRITSASARFDALSGTAIAVESGSVLNGLQLQASSSLTVQGNAQLDVVGIAAPAVTLRGSSLTRAETVSVTDLELENTAQLAYRLPSTAGFRPLAVTATGQLTLRPGTRIHVDGGGYLGAHHGGNGAQPRTFGNTFSSETGLYTGGSHGGWGGQYTGQGVGRPYGDVYQPTEAGGGGRGYSDGAHGGGGHGGGALRIHAGQLLLDGVISADGGNGPGSYPSGGAGGSVWITVDGTLSRSQSGVAVRANGAASYHGAGGGGRVAIYAGQFATTIDASTVQAIGGSSAAAFHGGPGTIVYGAGPQAAHLIVSTPAGLRSARGPTLLGAFGAATSVSGSVVVVDRPLVPGALVGRNLQTDLRAHNRAFTIVSNDASSITVAAPFNGALVTGGRFYVEDHHTTFASVTVDNAATVDAGHLSAAGLALARGSAELSVLALDAASLRVEGSARISAFEGGGVDVADDVVLANTARLQLASLVAGGLVELQGSSVITGHAPSTARVVPIAVQAAALTVGAAARIDGTGLGYLGAHEGGNGHLARTLGNVTNAALGLYSGGSHAGLGGRYPGQGLGETYGDPLFPDTPGGGGRGYSDGGWGAGGNGGTALRIEVQGALQLAGVIASNGAIGSGTYPSAGAGGSIWATAGTLAGAGRFEARGGNAYHGSGGGGRISVYAADSAQPIMDVAPGASSAAFVGTAGTARFNGS